MTRFWKKALRAVVALTLGTGAAAAPAQQQQPAAVPARVGSSAPAAVVAKAKPAMWKLADRDTTIYLFGTIHMLPRGTAWQTKKLQKALASSDELVTEIVLGGDQAAVAQTLLRLGVSPGLPPLEQRVPEEKREALRAMVKESGLPMAVLDKLETWAAALQLTSVTFNKLGLEKQQGVDLQLTRSALGGTGKPLKGLETVEEQFGFFDQLPEQVQRDFLLGVLEQPDDAKLRFREMLTAWSRGDVDGIASSFNSDLFTPELRERLLTERNRRWAGLLAERLKQPGKVFVAVGAGHLAGPDSVQHFLAERGLKVKRVQ